jgi:hypothetical protein
VIARRSLIPIDRRHIIGHYQVPDPNDPLQGGGIDNHTDPGRYWNWRYFLRLVRAFAYPARAVAHKHVGLRIDSSTLTNKQVVAGRVPWRTRVSGPVHRVAYLVDGKVRWTDRIAPFSFAGGRLFDTFGFRNGRHRLEVRAYGATSWTRQRFTIRVRNEAFTIVPVSLKPKQPVAGVVSVPALFTGVAPSRVLLYLDGHAAAHDTEAPFLFHWDTRRAKDGPHTLALAGIARALRHSVPRADRRREQDGAARENRLRLARRRPDRVRPAALARRDERLGDGRRVLRRRIAAADARESAVCVRLGRVELRARHAPADGGGDGARRRCHESDADGDGRGAERAVKPA